MGENDHDSNRSRGRTLGVIFTQVRAILPGLALVVAAVVMLGGIVLFVHYGTDADMALFLADPGEKSGLPAYAGFLTFAAILVWWTAATVAAMAAVLLRHAGGSLEVVRFFAELAGLVALLCLDDLFMIHEGIGLWIAEINDKPERRSTFELPVFLAYGAGWLVWLVRSWRIIFQTRWLFLGLAASGFGLSLTIDLGVFLFPEMIPDTPWMPTTLDVAEELSKMAGILFLLAWVFSAMIAHVGQCFDREGVTAGHIRSSGVSTII